MATHGAKIMETRAIQIELEIPIEASRERVWDALTNEVNDWWLPDFRVSGKPERVVFEPRVGGGLYEDAGNGAGLLWFTVVSLKPQESMHLVGQICPPFGGPATAMLYLVLEERGSETLLKITNALVGHVSDDAVDSIESGWRYLYEQGLKKFVEEGTIS